MQPSLSQRLQSDLADSVMFVTYFLLLSSLGLVITTQAQNCSKPVGGDNMRLKGEDILLQTFPEGLKVTFACNIGYVTAGGSPSITCTAGKWTTLKLTCERRDCGSAGEVDNGNVDYEGTQFGDKLVVTCNTGFYMVPKDKGQIICGDQGWLDRLPTCEVVTCDPPPAVANGVFSPVKESYDYSEVVQYKCQKDYTLSGSSSISCSEHGTFGPAPTCVLVRCEDPTIDNAHQTEGSRPPHGYRSTVTYECKSGYVMKGVRALTCGLDSQWAPALPTCQRRDCGSAGEVDNGNVDYPEGTQFGDKLVVTCNTGFKMVPKDKGEIICGAQGWLDRLPTCEVVRCEDPKIDNAHQTEGSRPPHGYRSTVTYECKSGYVMEGVRTLTCGLDSQWAPALPTCQMVTCDPPPAVANGVFSPVKESYDYGEVVQYKCQKGYTLSGSSSISCSEHGTFGPAPTCVLVRCDDPKIDNAHQTEGSRPPHGYGSTVTYECKSGYVMKGVRSLTCGLDSQWAPALPTCQRNNCGSAGEVDNGNIDYEGTQFGDKLVVTCNTGFNMVPKDKGQIFCGAQGWLERLPTCEVVTCDPPPAVANGVFSPVKESYDYSEVVQYKCQKGYTLSGSSSISCSEHGTFGPAPTCVLVRCEDPTIDNAHQTEGSRPPHGYRSTVTYECKSGYVMKGVRALTCGLDSQWSPALPTCQRIPPGTTTQSPPKTPDNHGNKLAIGLSVTLLVSITVLYLQHY
ncbi:C4b-binding protein alpha chain-like isoform X4 [Sander vitreus]